MLFGLTGGVGMGKSTAGKLLEEQGIAVVDTDVIARQVVEPGEPALEEIRRQFGDSVLKSDGSLDREEMARVVFSDGKARAALEAILHPRIRDSWQNLVKKWASEGRPQAVVTIPLLFETDSADLFDFTVCLACSSESQTQRLQQRNWNLDQIRQRIASQWPIHKKIALSDFVIWTDTPVEVHAEQIKRVFR